MDVTKFTWLMGAEDPCWKSLVGKPTFVLPVIGEVKGKVLHNY